MCFHIARAAWILLLAQLVACSTTPLDAVIAQDSGVSSMGDAGDAGDMIDAGPCFSPATGRFVLRSVPTGLCLGIGDPTTVFGNPGFQTNLVADCTLPGQVWALSSAGTAGMFTLKNVISGDNLDVKMAAVQNGTAVIAYPATGLDNQKFEARALGSASYELRPQHVSTSCVVAVGLSAQISTCAETDANQAWQLERADCL
jgi:Ricin-type beta-trefoil lectin domain-like